MKKRIPRSPLAPLAVALALGATPAGASPTLDWHVLLDGGSRQTDVGVKALTDTAGNLVVAGHVIDVAGNGNLVILALTRATGDSLWSRTIPGTPDNPKVIGDMTWDGAGDLLIGGSRLGCYG